MGQSKRHFLAPAASTCSFTSFRTIKREKRTRTCLIQIPLTRVKAKITRNAEVFNDMFFKCLRFHLPENFFRSLFLVGCPSALPCMPWVRTSYHAVLRAILVFTNGGEPSVTSLFEKRRVEAWRLFAREQRVFFRIFSFCGFLECSTVCTLMQAVSVQVRSARRTAFACNARTVVVLP